MSQKSLLCDQCSQEATVFALLPTYKACPLHAESLKERCPSVFTISAYDFRERAEYEGRDTERSDRYEAQRSLQMVKEVLPQIVTETQLRDEVKKYRLAGVEAMKTGNYTKARKKLERGWALLQQCGVESPQMCLQLGVVWAHFGEREEACSIYRRGLQHSSSPELSLQLSRSLVEVYFQTREWEKTVEAAESVLTSANVEEDSFELLQIVCFLCASHFRLGHTNKGCELVDYWTSRRIVNSVESKSALQVICAYKKYEEDSNEEAVGLYEGALPVLELVSPNSYFTLISRCLLAHTYAALKRQEQALFHYLKALTIFATHFPHTKEYVLYLENLADVYKSMNNVGAAEAYRLKALTIYSAHFPHTKEYATCLANLAGLYKDVNNVGAAEEQYLKALTIYSTHFLHTKEYAICLANLASLYKSMNNVEAAETYRLKALTIYSAHFPLTKDHANSLWNFGHLLKNIGRNGEAAARIEAALRIYLANNLQGDVADCQSALRELLT